MKNEGKFLDVSILAKRESASKFGGKCVRNGGRKTHGGPRTIELDSDHTVPS